MTEQGILGADNICNTNKPGYAPSGTYKALIASNSGGEVNDRTPADGWMINPAYYYYLCTQEVAHAVMKQNTSLWVTPSIL